MGLVNNCPQPIKKYQAFAPSCSSVLWYVHQLKLLMIYKIEYFAGLVSHFFNVAYLNFRLVQCRLKINHAMILTNGTFPSDHR